jgi:hypothetical protein
MRAALVQPEASSRPNSRERSSELASNNIRIKELPVRGKSCLRSQQMGQDFARCILVGDIGIWVPLPRVRSQQIQKLHQIIKLLLLLAILAFALECLASACKCRDRTISVEI